MCEGSDLGKNEALVRAVGKSSTLIKITHVNLLEWKGMKNHRASVDDLIIDDGRCTINK